MYAITTRIQVKKTEYDIFFQIVKEQNKPLAPKSETPVNRTTFVRLPRVSHLSDHRTNKIIGGGERDRTDDPLLAKQVLSQLSYTPR